MGWDSPDASSCITEVMCQGNVLVDMLTTSRERNQVIKRPVSLGNAITTQMADPPVAFSNGKNGDGFTLTGSPFSSQSFLFVGSALIGMQPFIFTKVCSDLQSIFLNPSSMGSVSLLWIVLAPSLPRCCGVFWVSFPVGLLSCCCPSWSRSTPAFMCIKNFSQILRIAALALLSFSRVVTRTTSRLVFLNEQFWGDFAMACATDRHSIILAQRRSAR